MPPTSNWDEELAHTGCVQCCSLIGNHVCHYGLSCENAVYSTPLIENCREGSLATLIVCGFFGFFSRIFASASTPGLPQHMEAITNLLNYSKMENY